MNQHDENPPQANARHEEIDWLKTPYYDGKDTLLKQQPYCYACKDQIAGLKRCSRCNVAWYCSAECQKKHFEIHREVCKQVAKDRKNMEQEAVVIRNWYNEDTNAFENLLETRVGDFPSPDTHDYLEARHCLADDLWDVAYDFGVKEVWEKSRFHYQELLRLDAKSPVLLRYRLPYILLYLNRDDEAFSYIRYWLNFDKLDEEEILTRHRQSREGEWLYPIEPNCRFLDIFQECPPIKNQREAAPFYGDRYHQDAYCCSPRCYFTCTRFRFDSNRRHQAPTSTIHHSRNACWY
ncbi:hypothetical protein FisN_28Lu091 [Fistulifera solaris]|uniref:MYND-type domain-containing protein n=1 Tax=Fistulifera solaris TaxID=1519565 RepID=A0A1Z5KT16_FISSO|nr:hypothetical protein FisN_28Lu091 [Fistulifera solaris]|eukprot:GAX29232.1 hypothetical protein FisN_28Lu091 [Fistulifera solaris]